MTSLWNRFSHWIARGYIHDLKKNWVQQRHDLQAEVADRDKLIDAARQQIRDRDEKLKLMAKRLNLEEPLPDFRREWELLGEQGMYDVHKSVLQMANDPNFRNFLRYVNDLRIGSLQYSMSEETVATERASLVASGRYLAYEEILIETNRLATTPLPE